MNSRKVEVRGVIAEVSVGAVTRKGSGVAVSVAIRNGGDAPVVCGNSGELPQCVVSLVNAETRTPAKLTTPGYNLLSGESHVAAHHGHVTIAKGEKKTWKSDLNVFYALEPGEYEMALTIKMNPRTPERTFRITVGKLRFKITE